MSRVTAESPAGSTPVEADLPAGSISPTLQPAPGSHARTVARNAVNLVLGQVTTTVFAIILSAALGRSLGVDGYGLYYLITTLTTFALVFVEWGQPFIVIRKVATNPEEAGHLLGTALVLRIGFTLCALVPVGLAAWALGYGARVVGLSILLMVTSLPLWLAQAYGMVFRGRDRMGSDASVTVLAKAALLLVTVPVLALGAGLTGAIVCQAVAGMVALGLAHRLYRRMQSPRLHFSRETAKEIFLLGAPILAMTAAISAQPYLDALILSRLAPASAVGWFGAARNILGTLMAPASILGAAAFPRLSRASKEPPPALAIEARGALRMVLLMGALACAGSFLFADTVVGLVYGSRGFAPAGTIIKIFSPGFLLLFIDILLGNIVYACGGATGFAVAKILSVIASSALDLVLIPYFQLHTGSGGIGVLVAFGVSEFIVFTGAIIVLPRGSLTSVAFLDVGRAVLASLVTIGLFRLVMKSAPLWAIPACVVVFAGASVALGLLRRQDFALIRTLFRRSGGPSPEAASP